MDTEPQEMRNMFDCTALSSKLDQHTLFAPLQGHLHITCVIDVFYNQ